MKVDTKKLLVLCEKAEKPGPLETYPSRFDAIQGVLTTETVRSLCTQLERAYESLEWRPIETAPKDGTWVLLSTSPSYVPWVGRFIDSRWKGADGHVVHPVPAHWMPLPPPPEVTK